MPPTAHPLDALLRRMRHAARNEPEQVMHAIGQNVGVRANHVAASAQFLAALAGVVDPEEKRNAARRPFFDMLQHEGWEASTRRTVRGLWRRRSWHSGARRSRKTLQRHGFDVRAACSRT